MLVSGRVRSLLGWTRKLRGLGFRGLGLRVLGFRDSGIWGFRVEVLLHNSSLNPSDGLMCAP